MSLSKLFNRIFWHNNTTPAINEDNLNAMSKAIDDIDDRVLALADQILETVPQIAAYLAQAEDLYEAMQTLSENPPYIGANGNWYVFDTTQQEYVDSGVDASLTIDIADVQMLPYGATPYITNTGTNTDPVFHLYIPRAANIVSITKTGSVALVDTYTVTTEDGVTTTFQVTNGKSITSVTKTGTSGLTDTYTITYNDGTTSTFTIVNGQDGRGISSIAKTGTSGLVDTYTITYTDGTTSTFTVTNGRDGSGAGDMLQADYDSDSTVKNAGGIKAWVQSLGYITGLAWSALTGKPFDSIGDGLTVFSDMLIADVSAVDLETIGTASANATSSQQLCLNDNLAGTVVSGSRYMETSTKTTSSGVDTFTFTNAVITANGVYDFYCDVYGVAPSDVVVSSGTMDVKFNSSDNVTTCRVYIK